MIRGRGHRPYRPPQLLTGHIDDFPLVPETPIDIVPRPILGNSATIEVLEAAKELAATAPPAAQETLRTLLNERILQQTSSPEASPSPAAISTALVLASNSGPVDRVEPATGDTSAPAIADVSPRPCTKTCAGGEAERAAKSRVSRGTNSRARKKSRRKKAKVSSSPPEFLSRRELHEAHCSICGDEFQEEIDEAFINWECVNQIAVDYKIDRRAIYRHAHATGLFGRRDRNIRRALGRIIHEADRITVTSDSVIRAAKMLTHINTRGAWVNPPTHVIFSASTAHSATASAPKLRKLSDTPCKVRKCLKP